MKFSTCTRRRGIGRSGSRQRLEHANEGSHRACAGADPDIDSGRAKPDAVRFSNEPANQSGDAACENRIADRLSGSLGICPILPRTRIAIYHEQPVAFGEEWAQHGSALVPRDQHTDPARSILREQGCRCHFRPVSSEPHRSKLGPTGRKHFNLDQAGEELAPAGAERTRADWCCPEHPGELDMDQYPERDTVLTCICGVFACKCLSWMDTDALSACDAVTSRKRWMRPYVEVSGIAGCHGGIPSHARGACRRSREPRHSTPGNLRGSGGRRFPR